MAFVENKEGALVYMTSTVIPVPHAFTTRYGGVSRGIFSSLNLSVSRGDEPENVRENYRRVCALLGLAEDGCALTRQVHGSVVRTVTRSDRHIPLTDVPYEADGLVTAEKGLGLMCFTADCVPVLLCDAENGVAAAVHCGWRGSAADILARALESMTALGAQREKICAALGPAIGRCCFETDGDVPEAIERYLSGDTEGLFGEKDNGKTLVDLRAANRRRLLQLGLREEKIDVSEECTFCSHEKYFSHRYTAGRRGIQSAVIVLR